MGNIVLAASSSSKGGTSIVPILFIGVLVLIVYMAFTRRGRARRAQQTQTDLVPGAPARTTAGMYGTVTSVEGDDVTLEVSPGVNIRMMRRAVVPLPMDASMGSTGPSANGASANGTGPDYDPEASHEAETGSESGTDEADTEDRDPQDRNV